jgi:pyridoxal phosphate enzyme (YggS family)
VSSREADLRQSLEDIEERIARACQSSGRKRSEVTLIGVTKTLPVETIQIAHNLGLKQFGENRFQEFLTKVDFLPDDIVWHFIGVLQSNKAKKIAERFATIHTVSSESALKEIDKANREIDILIEVNIAEEQQKSGILSEKVDELLRCIVNCKSVRYRGLMTVGPLTRNPEEIRPFFRKLYQLKERIGGEWLSMGMSNDFDVAIQEGATHIRVGTALFGARNYN